MYNTVVHFESHVSSRDHSVPWLDIWHGGHLLSGPKKFWTDLLKSIEGPLYTGPTSTERSLFIHFHLYFIETCIKKI